MESVAVRKGLYDGLAWVTLAVALIVVGATFRAYGVAWDEQGETVYGSLLLDYYRSWFQDRSAYEFINFRFYGGGFELLSALLTRISPFGEYETRHLFSALWGVVGLVATWRLARLLGGARAGVLALLLLVLNPSWYGNMFINARDVPFASGMMCCLLLTVRALGELPTIRTRTAVLFGIALGWTLSVRIGGVLAIVFVCLPIGLWLIERARSAAPFRELRRDAVRIAGSLALAFTVGWVMMVTFWPWAGESLLNPLRALTTFSSFPFDGSVLFGGELIPANALPSSYLPVLLAVKQPELLVIGVGVALLFALHRWPSPLLGLASLRILTVAFAAALPVLYCVVDTPVDYNGMRHFLFVLPPLSVLAALAFDRMLGGVAWPVLRVGLGVALALALVAQLRTLIVLHPDQYVYYNAFIGGPSGAQDRYELDYWGTSLAEATQRLTDELERRHELPAARQPPYKVYVCANVWSASTYFPKWLVPVERIEQADFQIAVAEFYCKHPEHARRVLEVTRDGALLSFVDDLRPRPSMPDSSFSLRRPQAAATP